jgi:hypothetical protein
MGQLFSLAIAARNMLLPRSAAGAGLACCEKNFWRAFMHVKMFSAGKVPGRQRSVVVAIVRVCFFLPGFSLRIGNAFDICRMRAECDESSTKMFRKFQKTAPGVKFREYFYQLLQAVKQIVLCSV